MELPANLSIGSVERYSSTVKAARRVLKEFKRNIPNEIDMYRLRVGKTIYFFASKEKMENKIVQLDIEDFDYAEPGDKLSDKKVRL